MKRIGLLFVLFPLLALAQEPDEVTVSNATEFINAIQSNRIIHLKPGEYHLDKCEQMKDYDPREADREESLTRYVNYTKIQGITLYGVSDLEIRGQTEKPGEVRLLTADKTDWVLAFEECENVGIYNVEAEHDPKAPGGCTGGVFYFRNTTEGFVTNCSLKGSGSVGITSEWSKQIQVNNTKISECTSGILTLLGGKQLSFSDCHFFNNESTSDFIDIAHGEDILFDRVKFDFNTAIPRSCGSCPNELSAVFFRLEDTKDLRFEDCSMTGNTAANLCLKKDQVALFKKVKKKKNNFDKETKE